MKNIHPAQILKCSETEVEKAISWRINYEPTERSTVAIRAAAARIYGHTTRHTSYPIKAHLNPHVGQFGYRRSETQKFKRYCEKAFAFNTFYLLTKAEYRYLSHQIQKYYLKQLAIYSDINKLEILMENYRAC